ncbi:MAG: DUF1275 domain-containing protein [Gammaproteobacteria bacterium]|nr:DUF1275 domain-containing protein [Gammaproteobacteria bacterium]
MMSKLPKWIEYGAFTLAVLAGCINVIGLLGFQHQAVSHLSGTASQLGTTLLDLSGESIHLAVILFSFLLGSMISGFLLSGSSLKLGRHYDSLLLIEAVLLVIAIYFLQQHDSTGHYFASAACGLQNALATRYSGAVVRTTHLTGIFTDLGIMFGAALRKETFDTRKFVLFILIILGFVLGGTLGAYCYQALQFNALYIPAAMSVTLAFAYRIYWKKSQR